MYGYVYDETFHWEFGHLWTQSHFNFKTLSSCQVHPQGLWKLSWMHFFRCSQKQRIDWRGLTIRNWFQNGTRSWVKCEIGLSCAFMTISVLAYLYALSSMDIYYVVRVMFLCARDSWHLWSVWSWYFLRDHDISGAGMNTWSSPSKLISALDELVAGYSAWAAWVLGSRSGWGVRIWVVG